MKFRALLYCHLMIFFLLGTFTWAPTRVYWDQLDLFFFHLLNDPLHTHPSLQIFWAFANHKWADWIEDLCILGFFYAYVRNAPKMLRKRKIAELLFCTLYIALIIFFVNRLLFRSHLQFPRESPTLVVDGSLHLSDAINWLHIKDESTKCFPADHATTAILFGASFSYFAGWRFGIPASLYALFLSLPRMAAGAHWLSDALVGSGTIVLFFLSWALCTPLHRLIIDFWEWLFSLFSRLRTHLSKKFQSIFGFF
jgi:Kdo2-lipid A phosphotransferase